MRYEILKRVSGRFKLAAFTLLVFITSAVPVFAADENLTAIETALTTSFTKVGTSMTSIISKVIPIALPIIAAVMVVVFGIKVFKRITNKA